MVIEKNINEIISHLFSNNNIIRITIELIKKEINLGANVKVAVDMTGVVTIEHSHSS